MFHDVARRSQRRQDIDESEHLGLEHWVPHRPIHQAPIEILASEEAGSALVFVDKIKDFPAKLLNFRLNRHYSEEGANGSRSQGFKEPRSQGAKEPRSQGAKEPRSQEHPTGKAREDLGSNRGSADLDFFRKSEERDPFILSPNFA